VKSTASERVGPLSVQLSASERRRLAAHAKKRRLKVATAARVFLGEYLSELEDRAELTAAEEWQRAQAWATWEKIKAGDVREASLEELHAIIAKARRSAARRSRSG
jgi:hypothetical protein